MKGIYDINLPYKFVVSGSGSLELKEKIHESLAGRKQIFSIEPISFIEFANYKLILHKVTPYFRNARKEVTKSPIYYFTDHGLRNYLLGLFGMVSLPPVLTGYLFENIVFNMLRHSISPPASIHFWRTRDNAEVDFILQKGLIPVPIEVKYKKGEVPTFSRSFKSFLAAYKPKTGYIVHLGKKMEIKAGATLIHFLPFYILPQTVAGRPFLFSRQIRFPIGH